MNYLLTLFIFLPTVLSFGQSSIELGLLIKSWTQGKIDQNGNVIQADINRGGWYQLNIRPDKTVIFGGTFTCGFGLERHGKWRINNEDTTMTFSFYICVGYINTLVTAKIHEIEI